MGFDNIIGNENVKDLLNKTVSSNNILHSYLFSGEEGIGKLLFAKEFAKMILCQGDIKPCNSCKSCWEFENDNNPDFAIIEKGFDEDKNKEKNYISIDQIRYMNEKIAERPIIANRKVYIINDADTMRKEAQNALLKTLEEPPEYATIILVSSNESQLLTTIKSRCIKINFNRLSDEEILKYLREKRPDDINEGMIRYAEGSLGKALEIIHNRDIYEELEKLIDNMNKKNLIYILNNSDILYKEKESIYDFLEYINVLLLKTNELKKINCIKYIEEAKKRLLANSNYDMTIDNLLMKMWEEINEKYYRS